MRTHGVATRLSPRAIAEVPVACERIAGVRTLDAAALN
jgi:hypothetical protein